MNGTLSRVI